MIYLISRNILISFAKLNIKNNRSLDYLKIIELVGVVFNILFLVFLTKEKKVCWIFGIIGSLLGAFVLFKNNYYSETLLYLFYASIGIYGYSYWSNKRSDDFIVKRMQWSKIINIILAGLLISFGLGYLMAKTDASKPYYDALSSVFGVIATFLELYKYLVSWSFWIVINTYTIWLYDIKELDFLKIDTQGAEYEILKGIGNYFPLVIKIEVQLFPLYKDLPHWTEMLNYIHKLDYMLCAWEENYSHVTQSPVQMDMIFIPNYLTEKGKNLIKVRHF